jgi:hypothetical protein
MSSRLGADLICSTSWHPFTPISQNHDARSKIASACLRSFDLIGNDTGKPGLPGSCSGGAGRLPLQPWSKTITVTRQRQAVRVAQAFVDVTQPTGCPRRRDPRGMKRLSGNTSSTCMRKAKIARFWPFGHFLNFSVSSSNEVVKNVRTRCYQYGGLNRRGRAPLPAKARLGHNRSE